MRPAFPSARNARGLRWRSLLVVTPLFLGGCQVIGGLGGVSGPGFNDGVVYQGFIEIDGGELPAALEIIRAGGRNVRGALQTSSGLLAEGEGRIRGGTLTLDLTYGGECPGRMVLEGEWDEDTLNYEGRVEASDCTGNGRGGFRFSAS